MEHVLFKISWPAEFHAQTAVEAALALHQRLRAMGRGSDDIASVRVRTHEACIRIIDKHGPLHNPAARDHALQYMVAVPLIFGRLTADDYEEAVAADPSIDALRAKIECVEEPAFTRDYHDPDQRAITNALTITLTDGSRLPESLVAYPIRHHPPPPPARPPPPPRHLPRGRRRPFPRFCGGLLGRPPGSGAPRACRCSKPSSAPIWRC